MKASVIIPAYNEEESIGAALKAVIAQEYGRGFGADFEVIVVDNASGDRTAEVARGFSGVKVVTETHKGTMWACERGRTEASGEIIVRMDADCLPERDWLARGVKHFEDSRIAVVSGPYDYFDGGWMLRWTTLLTEKYIYRPVHLLLQAVKAGGITVGGNTFMRASALKAAGGFDTSIIFYGDDTDVPKRLSKFGRCIFDVRLVMKTSARRYRKEGSVRLAFRYIGHFFRVVFTKSNK